MYFKAARRWIILPDTLSVIERPAGIDARRKRRMAQEVLGVLSHWGYEEESLPPWVDYESLRPAFRRFAGEGCKFIGPDGRVGLLLPDGTLGLISRWLQGSWPGDGPQRVSYECSVYRAIGGSWRRLSQAGAELINVRGPEGNAEILGAAAACLNAVPGISYHIVVNDIRIARLMSRLAAREGAAAGMEVDPCPLLTALARGDYVSMKNMLQPDTAPPPMGRLWDWLTFRGGPEAAARLREEMAEHGGDLGREAAAVLADLIRLADLTPLAGDRDLRILVDLGLMRDVGYYDDFVFQVIAGSGGGAGEAVGGGGRYDGLPAGFGRGQIAAAGFAIDLDSLAATADGGELPMGGPDYVIVPDPGGGSPAWHTAWREADRLRRIGFSAVITSDARRYPGGRRVFCTAEGPGTPVEPPEGKSVSRRIPARRWKGLPDGVH